MQDQRSRSLILIFDLNLSKRSTKKIKYQDQAQATILLEFTRWTTTGSWRRKPKREAVQSGNIIDAIYVLTWKRLPGGNRQIKCRLCLRGFKDKIAGYLLTYSGTFSQWGQRLICAIAAQKRWRMLRADVSMAFLKGLTL